MNTAALIVLTDKIIIGAELIGRRLGVCTRTVCRLIAAGRLRAFKLNPPSGPWRCLQGDNQDDVGATIKMRA